MERANEGQPNHTPGIITVEPAKNFVRDRYAFVARTAEGEIVLRSNQFTSTMFRMGDGKTERSVLRNLINELAILGWQAVPSGGKWYEHRIYFVGHGKVGTTATTSEQRGLSPTAMWGWSVAIIVLLFFLCVILVLTSELRIGPAYILKSLGSTIL